jgi:hypothetical protein
LPKIQKIGNKQLKMPNSINVKHCIECSNGDIDIKVQNGVRFYGEKQSYRITVKKQFGKYHYSDNSMFSPDKCLNQQEKEELTAYIEDRFNIEIEN